MTRLSKSLTKVLRHTAAARGIRLTPDGFARVSEVLALAGMPPNATQESVEEVVKADAKQRFGLKREQDGTLWIRANQGHSVAGVDRDALLTRIERVEDLPPVCVHGTRRDAWTNHISKEGLCRMGRNEIHLASEVDSSKVISGMRQSSEILVYVDGRACLERDVPLYRSANGVVLCPGLGPRGVLPTGFFSRVVDARTGEDVAFERSFDVVTKES